MLGSMFRSPLPKQGMPYESVASVQFPEAFAEAMREEVDQYLKQMMEAVNTPDGDWIGGSEEQVL